MKTFFFTSIFLVLMAACSNQQSESEATNDTSDSLKNSFGKKESVKDCYAQIGVDTLKMQVTTEGNKVSGNLYIHHKEKDINNGTFTGTMKGDTLLAWYRFGSEGVESVRQIAFLKKGDALIEGFGPIDEKNDTAFFVRTGDLTFSEKMRLEKQPCN